MKRILSPILALIFLAACSKGEVDKSQPKAPELAKLLTIVVHYDINKVFSGKIDTSVNIVHYRDYLEEVKKPGEWELMCLPVLHWDYKYFK